MDAGGSIPAYRKLFEPIRINSKVIRNRLLQTAHAPSWHYSNGLSTSRDVHYHTARARGGVGLMITGNRLIHPTSMAATRSMLYGYRRENLANDRRLTSAVHEHGARIFVQLNHFGGVGDSSSLDDYRVLWSSSATKPAGFGEMPKAMDESEIDAVVEGWMTTALLAREADFDGVEIHLANGYLLHQFISPLFNRRNDEYGGSLENRLRLPLTVLRTVRQAVGRDFPMGIRLPVDDIVAGGLSAEEWAGVACSVAKEKLIDFITVSASTHHSAAHIIPPGDIPAAWLCQKTARLKRLLPDLPVLLSGAIGDATTAEKALANGAADMVAMTRALIADPELPNKVARGETRSITRCIRCNQGCVARSAMGRPMTCILNPAAGREQWMERLASHSQRGSPEDWVVVGGGPAGMKAAESLARQGHRVVLYERSSQLGGQVRLAAAQPRRSDFAWLVEDLESSLVQLGVRVQLNADVRASDLSATALTGIVVATGGSPETKGYTSAWPHVAGIPGSAAAHVLNGWEVIQNAARVVGDVVLIEDQGSRYVAGIAEILLGRGHRVHLVTPMPALFPKMATTLDTPFAYRAVFAAGLTYDLNSWVREIRECSVESFNLYAPEVSRLIRADTVVLATGTVANGSLLSELSRIAPERVIRGVGDCVAPRTLGHAIYEGHMLGLRSEGPDRQNMYIEPGMLDEVLT